MDPLRGCRACRGGFCGYAAYRGGCEEVGRSDEVVCVPLIRLRRSASRECSKFVVPCLLVLLGIV
jgi:hypothetical protein